MIQRVPAEGRWFTCTEHPDLFTDEQGAVDHLRTIHSTLWQQMAQIQVLPGRVGPPEERAHRRNVPRTSAGRTRRRRRR